MNIGFFGCWNKRGEERNKVLESIKEIDDLDHLFVLGDNYYSDVWKRGDCKNKHIQEWVIEDGFNLLNKINCKKTIGIGNHEMDEIGTRETRSKSFFKNDI